MLKFTIPFLAAFLLSAVLMRLAVILSERIPWLGRRSDRHIHQRGVHRLGGIALAAAFVIAVAADPSLVLAPETWGLLIGSSLAALVGLRDDIKELHWRWQLAFQAGLSFLAFLFGIRIYAVSNPFGGGLWDLSSGYAVIASAALAIFWMMLVMNSLNWVDGVDGLSGGISFISAMAIFFLSLKPEVNQPPMAIISLALAGSSLGFLAFNFNPSRILAGTSGTMFLGFVLASLSIFAGTKIATAIMVMAIPLIDLIWVIGERIRNGKSVFQPDRNHLHHKLLAIGWSQRRIAISYYAVTIVAAAIALNTRAIGKLLTLGCFVLLMASAYVLIGRAVSKKA